MNHVKSAIMQRAFEKIQQKLDPIEVTIGEHVQLPTERQPYRNGHVITVMGHEFQLDNTLAGSMVEPIGDYIVEDFVYGLIMPEIMPEIHKLILEQENKINER